MQRGPECRQSGGCSEPQVSLLRETKHRVCCAEYSDVAMLSRQLRGQLDHYRRNGREETPGRNDVQSMTEHCAHADEETIYDRAEPPPPRGARQRGREPSATPGAV